MAYCNGNDRCPWQPLCYVNNKFYRTYSCEAHQYGGLRLTVTSVDNEFSVGGTWGLSGGMCFPDDLAWSGSRFFFFFNIWGVDGQRFL